MKKKDFLSAIDELEAAGIAREITINALKEAFESTVKKKNYEDALIQVDIVPEEGKIDIYNIKHIVEDVEDDNLQVSLEDAQVIRADAKIGEDLYIAINVDEFSRQEALKFKSILKQKIKEAEKATIYAAYADKVGEIVTGYVEKVEPRYTLINLGRTSVILSDKQKIGDEKYTTGQMLKVYLSEVNASSQGPQITVSRSDAGFLKRLFEEEVHDVYDGTVVIKDIAREAGERSKVSVYTQDPNVDPVGACIGQGGSKIQKICAQLNREKIDIVQYHIHQGLFIAESLKPATVIGVRLNEDAHTAVAVVKNDDLRVAIGKRGVNARLAVRLTGWKIDIKELDTAVTEGIIYDTMDQMARKEEEMIFEKRRKEILEQQAKEEQARKERLEKQMERAEELTVEEVESETIHTEKTIEEEPVVEEKPVEFTPIILKPKISLADLEQQIEEEKRRNKMATAGTGRSFSKTKREEEQAEQEEKAKLDPSNYMKIYTEEELQELEGVEEVETPIEDEEIDYTEYDKYYDR